jgi:hypothetical protein
MANNIKTPKPLFFLTLSDEVALDFAQRAPSVCKYWDDEKDLARINDTYELVKLLTAPIPCYTDAQVKCIVNRDRPAVDVACQLVLFGFLVYG